MSQPRRVDVLVAGSGPAGAAAATELARSGRSVVLADKASFPRDKCCGDGLTTAAVRHLDELGFDPAQVPSWQQVRRALVAGDRGEVVELPLADDSSVHAASARRAELDWALSRLAVGAGASLMEGTEVLGLRLVSEGVEARLANDESLLARYVVAADGAWSKLRKLVFCNEPLYLGDWQAGRQYYGEVSQPATDLWVWFDPDMLPGYAWSFPLAGGFANVGYGVSRSSGSVGKRRSSPGSARTHLKGQHLDFARKEPMASVLGTSARPTSPWKAWPIPARISAKRLAAWEGRVLFVGDAARACDPMTGEGIAQALETGRLAACALDLAGPHRPWEAERRYRRQVRLGMALDHWLARRLSGVLARPGGPNAAARLLNGGDWRRAQFARWMFEDYPRAALATPHRWHRGMFRGSGGFGSPAGAGSA